MKTSETQRRRFSVLATLVAVGAGLLAGGAALAQSVQGVSATEIVVGSILDLSGPVVSVGAPQRDGMTLAVEEINAAGGIHGRKLRLVVEDSGADPKKGVLAAQKLLTQDKVFALVGVLASGVYQATAPAVIDRGVPMLFPLITSPLSYQPVNDLKFGYYGVAEDHVRATVKYAFEKLGKRKIGIFYQDDETGLAALRAGEEQMKVHGVAFVEKVSHKRGEIAFSAQVSKLKAAGLDIVLLALNPREVAAFTVEAKTQGLAADRIAPWGVIRAVNLLAQGASEGLYGMAQFVPVEAQEATPEFKALADRFKTRFGRDLGDAVNFGYASTMLFAEGLRQAGPNLTPQTLARGLERVKNFKTAFDTPAVSYGPGEHAPPREVFAHQVRAGKWVKLEGPMTY